MQTRKRFSHINSIAAKYYIECFEKSKKAQDYVYSRISKETAKKFYIGYAPRYGLIDVLNKHKVSQEEAEELGFIGLNYEDDTVYETFSSRIMIPIIHANTILGFGGRTLIDNPTKYLNSKATSLYNKGEVLYGLWTARKSIHKLGFVILVEGYFDVLGLFEYGIRNVVAICGTAFSINHAKMLKRYTEKAIILFDADKAGIIVAGKAKKILTRQDLVGKIVKLPGKLDPDEFVAKYGPEKFNTLIGGGKC